MKMRFPMALAAALVLSGCVMGDFGSSDRYQSDFHYTFDLQPGGRLNVETFNGSVEVNGWDQDKVDITGTKSASTEELRDAIKIDIHNSPVLIDIRTVRPSSHFGNLGARFTIHVPRKTLVDRITTSNGALRIGDVAAASHLKSSNGSIRVANVASDVEARTSNGSIELDSIHGRAQMKTSNGRIRAENVEGNCEAETSNSSITVRLDNAQAAPIRLSTSNGGIDLTLTRTPQSDIRLETRNGGIGIHLPPNASVRVNADTSNSSISSDFDVAAQVHGDSNKHHLEGIIGSGGPTIDMKTSNGHIRIAKGMAD